MFGPLLQSFSVGGRQTAIGMSDKPLFEIIDGALKESCAVSEKKYEKALGKKECSKRNFSMQNSMNGK